MGWNISDTQLKEYQRNLGSAVDNDGRTVDNSRVSKPKKVNSTRESTVDKEPDRYVQGWHPSKPTIAGKAHALGPVHRWQRRDSERWLARCGRERHKPGWKPSGSKRGRACPWCWED